MNKNMLVEVKGKLEKQLQEKFEALPGDLNKTRFIQNALSVLSETKSLQQCSQQSVVIGMLKGAFLGLDFFRKECYLIKYGDQANFMTDYKGERKLAKKYSINPIKDIYAKLVREDDFFQEEVINGEQSINFKPKPFNDNEILGVFAVVLYKDGTMIYEAMSKAEVESIKEGYSKKSKFDGSFSGAWVKTWGEMAKKTALRRLLKSVELDFDNNEQEKAFDDFEDIEKEEVVNKKEETVNPFSEIEEAQEIEEIEETKQESANDIL